MIHTAFYLDNRRLSIVVVICACCLAVFLPFWMTTFGLDYREVIGVFVALIGIITLLTGERGLVLGFLGWIATFGLGFRTVEVTPNLRIHPGEVVLWGLLLLWLTRRIVVRQEQDRPWLPKWLVIMLPLWLWAWWVGSTSGLPWDSMLSELLDFVLLIPIFFVSARVLAKRNNWRYAILSFYITGAWIAGMGILEYVMPQSRSLFPGFVSNPNPSLTTEGFWRANFSFWGSPDATLICTLTVPLAIAIWHWWAEGWQRALTLLALSLLLTGIYIGGHRDTWFILAVISLCWIYLRYGAGWAVLFSCTMLLAYQVFGDLIPAATADRARTIIVMLQGTGTESSALDRWHRIVFAFDSTLSRPFGGGWASAGWVHCDFLQVAANLGILAGVLFFGAYLVTLVRLWSRVRAINQSEELGRVGIPLVLAFIVAGLLLSMEAMIVLPQLILPVWFVWALAEIWLRQTSAPKGNWNAAPSYLRLAAHI